MPSLSVKQFLAHCLLLFLSHVGASGLSDLESVRISCMYVCAHNNAYCPRAGICMLHCAVHAVPNLPSVSVVLQ